MMSGIVEKEGAWPSLLTLMAQGIAQVVSKKEDDFSDLPKLIPLGSKKSEEIMVEEEDKEDVDCDGMPSLVTLKSLGIVTKAAAAAAAAAQSVGGTKQTSSSCKEEEDDHMPSLVAVNPKKGGKPQSSSAYKYEEEESSYEEKGVSEEKECKCPECTAIRSQLTSWEGPRPQKQQRRSLAGTRAGRLMELVLSGDYEGIASYNFDSEIHNERHEDGETLLIAASRLGHSSIVKLLLLASDDQSLLIVDDFGRNALHSAAMNGHLEVCIAICNRAGTRKMILISMFSKDRYNCTPTCWAVIGNHKSTAVALTLCCKVGVYSTRPLGGPHPSINPDSPLSRACTLKFWDIASTLVWACTLEIPVVLPRYLQKPLRLQMKLAEKKQPDVLFSCAVLAEEIRKLSGLGGEKSELPPFNLYQQALEALGAGGINGAAQIVESAGGIIPLQKKAMEKRKMEEEKRGGSSAARFAGSSERLFNREMWACLIQERREIGLDEIPSTTFATDSADTAQVNDDEFEEFEEFASILVKKRAAGGKAGKKQKEKPPLVSSAIPVIPDPSLSPMTNSKVESVHISDESSQKHSSVSSLPSNAVGSKALADVTTSAPVAQSPAAMSSLQINAVGSKRLKPLTDVAASVPVAQSPAAVSSLQSKAVGSKHSKALSDAPVADAAPVAQSSAADSKEAPGKKYTPPAPAGSAAISHNPPISVPISYPVTQSKVSYSATVKGRPFDQAGVNSTAAESRPLRESLDTSDNLNNASKRWPSKPVNDLAAPLSAETSNSYPSLLAPVTSLSSISYIPGNANKEIQSRVSAISDTSSIKKRESAFQPMVYTYTSSPVSVDAGMDQFQRESPPHSYPNPFASCDAPDAFPRITAQSLYYTSCAS